MSVDSDFVSSFIHFPEVSKNKSDAAVFKRGRRIVFIHRDELALENRLRNNDSRVINLSLM